jgi:hypothetical protein
MLLDADSGMMFDARGGEASDTEYQPLYDNGQRALPNAFYALHNGFQMPVNEQQFTVPPRAHVFLRAEKKAPAVEVGREASNEGQASRVGHGREKDPPPSARSCVLRSLHDTTRRPLAQSRRGCPTRVPGRWSRRSWR